MQSGLTGITGSIVEYALDGLSLRHTAIAANIANANSAGYRPMRVSFENQISALINAAGTESTSGTAPMQLPAPLISTEPPVADALRRSALENEIVQLNRNVLQYQALIKGLDKYTSTISAAINEGKR